MSRPSRLRWLPDSAAAKGLFLLLTWRWLRCFMRCDSVGPTSPAGRRGSATSQANSARLQLGSLTNYYWFVAAIASLILGLLWRFHRSTVGSVLVAIRENEQRAQFLGIRRTAISLPPSCCLPPSPASPDPAAVPEPHDVGRSDLGGILRRPAGDGRDRRYAQLLGPALGALFFVLFREFLGIYTENWLFWFGLVFVAFSSFADRPCWRRRTPDRAIPQDDRRGCCDGRADEVCRCRNSCGQRLASTALCSPPRHIQSFGGINAVQGVTYPISDRTLHALIGPNGAGKTTAFNLLSGMFAPDQGTVLLLNQPIAGQTPEDIAIAGIGRSFQITNLFPALTSARISASPCRRGTSPLRSLTNALSIEAINRETDATIRYLGLAGSRRPRPGCCPTAGTPRRHGRGAGHRTAHPAAGRTAGGTCRRRTRAHRRDHQAHLDRPPGAAGRA